jgi:hypothetical protein
MFNRDTNIAHAPHYLNIVISTQAGKEVHGRNQVAWITRRFSGWQRKSAV